MVTVEILTGSTFIAGDQQVLFQTGSFQSNVAHRQYDVSADGERFVFVTLSGSGAAYGQLITADNFLEELEERVGG